jgi:hypothetical integral membrane protein (TIGR02206 family)
MKMQTFFRYHSKLEPFRIFSVEHVVTMGIIFALCIFLVVKKSELEKKLNRRYFRITLALLLLILDGLQHLWLVSEHAWSLKSDLPLQLSDLAVIFAVLMLLTKSYKLFQFMYFAGIGSSIQAILTPDLGKFSFPHIQYIEFFVRHGGVVLACLFMVVAFHYRPTVRSMWVTIMIVNLYAILIFFLNKVLESNYLYIMKKPGNSTLLNYLGPWPWYLLSMEIVMIVSFYILYSPFWIRKLKTQFD